MSRDRLPAGYTHRPPEMRDAAAIFELVAAYNTPIVGYADYTVDDARDELADPDFDHRRNAWMVFDAGGRLVGYGWAHGHEESSEVEFDVITSDDAVADWLVARSMARAREMAREHGRDQVFVDKGIYRADEAMRTRFETLGFEPVTSFHRMRIDHAAPVAEPAPPVGAVVRSGSDGEAVWRAAYEVLTSAFEEHFGFVRKSYADWRQSYEAKSTFDWSQLSLLELDAEPVAVCTSTDQFVADEDCGYVWQLGVVEAARGRGVAKYLLRRAFAVDAAAGRAGTILHVDSNNTTPALGLYESVGMRAVLVVDIWRQTLSVDGVA